MKPISEATFIAEVLGSKGPSVVKFEAPWCGPCKAMKPVLAGIEAEMSDRVQFFSANVDECPAVAQRFRITQVPTLVAFENGNVSAIKSGASSKSQIVKWIETTFPDLKPGG